MDGFTVRSRWLPWSRGRRGTPGPTSQIDKSTNVFAAFHKSARPERLSGIPSSPAARSKNSGDTNDLGVGVHNVRGTWRHGVRVWPFIAPGSAASQRARLFRIRLRRRHRRPQNALGWMRLAAVLQDWRWPRPGVPTAGQRAL